MLYGDEEPTASRSARSCCCPSRCSRSACSSDERIEIYDCGREDIQSGQIDRRVLATLAYLAESGPAAHRHQSLKCGHGFFTSSGNVSHHSSGNAVDIAKINGVPILGHQEPGGITEQSVRRLMRLQGTIAPDQIISLLDIGGATVAMGDHADHIHVGFRPLFGANSKLGKQALAVLKPGQWSDLLDQLRKIDNPVVPTKPSKYAIPVKKPKRASDAHQRRVGSGRPPPAVRLRTARVRLPARARRRALPRARRAGGGRRARPRPDHARRARSAASSRAARAAT